jgi:CcmD family protein
VLAFALGFLALSGAPRARAQGEAGAGAQDAADQRAQSFQAVQGAVREDVPGGPLLVSAYAAIWVIMLLYMVRLVRLQQRAQIEVERLERVLAHDAPATSPLPRAGDEAAPALHGGGSGTR